MTTLTVNQHREQMLRWLGAGRGYEFLTMAAPYLLTCTDDDQIRLLACQEYLKLGLVEPARDLLNVEASSPELQPQLDVIRSTLDALQGKRIDWSTLSQRFDRNLDALEKRGVDTASIRQSWEQNSASYQLFSDNAGIEQVRRRIDNGQWQWIPRLGDHETIENTRDLPDDTGAMMPGPYLFEGLDLGWFFERVYRATLDTFHGYSCGLFIVMPDPASLAMVLHLRDWEDILTDSRCYWFLGSDCAEKLGNTLLADANLPAPTRSLRAGSFVPMQPPDAITVVEEVLKKRHLSLEPSYRRIASQYERRDAKFWAKRFAEALSGDGPPLRILAAVSTHTTFLKYSMRDTKRAFESLGHQCRVLTEATPHHVISTMQYHQAITEWDPDIFFNIDHLRPEFPEIAPPNLPVLTWDQDRLPTVFTKENMDRIGPLDFVTGWSKPQCVSAGCDERQFLYARVPTCPEQFSGEPLTEEERKRFSCDVSYVSHASQTPEAFHQEELARTDDPRMKRLLTTLFEMLPPVIEKYGVLGGAVQRMALEQASRQCGVQVESEEGRSRLMGWYMWRLGDRIFRHEALEWAATWATQTGRSLRIYGKGWENHPTLSAFAAGPVENGRDLLCLYRASNINLQLMPAGFVHQRALDGLSAGGFFLARQTPSDIQGHLLRKLINRINDSGISSTRELLAAPDEELQRLLKEFAGDWLCHIEPDFDEFFQVLRCLGEEPFPVEVFGGFDRILFNSMDQFATKADQFLAAENERIEIASSMREAVIRHYSYDAAMKRFLEAMNAYLQKIAP